MGSKLLVRSYNVGCGDCIYVCIPNGNDGFHILIDCGSKEGANTGVMKRSIKHLEDKVLPNSTVAGKKRLDLIVVTHRHEDHIKGFDPKFFKNIAIGNIWITGAMDETHVQAKKVRALHGYVKQEMRALAKNMASLSPELRDLVGLYGISNTNATKALTETLPAKNGIKPTFVFAGDTSDSLGVTIPDATIKVLAPEKDIDGYYLGKDADDRLRGMTDGGVRFASESKPIRSKTPSNISDLDFRNLKKRFISNALAFAVDDSQIQNNVSTVILIEWKGKRLLFVGDAEWKNGFRDGKKNGSWNVMWKVRNNDLSKPVDFLKIGHHGSHNATPWNRHADDSHEVNQIFNSILPLPKSGLKPTAKCVVSTKRKQYDTIPDARLLVEIGKRVANTAVYSKKLKNADSNFDPVDDVFNYDLEKDYSSPPKKRQVGEIEWFDKPQPMRTDLESEGRGSEKMLTEVEFVDVEIDS